MIPRKLEPEVMDSPEEAQAYDAMNHAAVNESFVADFLAVHGPCRGGEILDVGTGTARIPIELCRVDARARVLAVDLSESMIALATANVREAGLGDRIRCRPEDAKSLRLAGPGFEAVVSNSIVHHIPEPTTVLREVSRLAAPGGTVFVRDLARPTSEFELARLVELYTGGESERGRLLFEDSLRAALTVGEVASLIENLGLPSSGVKLTSDRHWTWIWQRPERG